MPRRSFEELRDDLLQVASLASFYAENASGFSSNSVAAKDAHDSRYAIPRVSEPGLEATLMAGRSLALSADFVRGIAHLLPVNGVLFSELALVRPTMSSASKCLYLTEPEIDTRERVRRWANLAIESAVEEANVFSDGSPERSRRLAKLEDLQAIAEKIGQPIKVKGKQIPGLVQARSIGAHESEMTMVKRLIKHAQLATTQTGDVNLLMYRLTSSLIHGQDYGQLMHYIHTAMKPSSHPSVLTAPVGISLEKAALWFTSVLLALLTAAESFLRHQGKSVAKLHQDVMPLLQEWRSTYPVPQ